MKETKSVLITGASNGIGRETSFKFARAGYSIGICYNKDKESSEEVASKCVELGATDVLTIEVDLEKDSDIKNCLDLFIKKFKKIDILINNAGVLYEKPALEHSFGELQHLVNVNVADLMKMTNEAFPHIKKGDGVIINIASAASKEVFSNIVPYCATKFAVRGYTMGLALELPKNVRVYSVNPGLTATKMTRFRGVHPEKVAEIIFNTAEEKYDIKSGEEIDVEEYL